MNPLDRRQELRDELRRARMAEDTQRAAAQRLGREHRAADKADDDALTNLIRKGGKEAEKALAETRTRRDSIAQQLATATERAEAAGRARLQIDRDLEELHLHEFEAFSREAETATQQAHAAIRALRGPYVEALGAWSKAASSWAPLKGGVVEALLQHEAEVGVFPDSRYRFPASVTPAFPLPDLVGIVEAVEAGTLAARPRGLSITEPPELPENVVEEVIRATP